MTLAFEQEIPRRRPPAPPRAPSAPGATSPFIPISQRARYGVIAFVLIYQAFTPALLAVTHGIADPHVGVRMLLNAGYWILALLPLFFYRRDYGWLHPLIFPLLYSILQNLATEPMMLVSPLAVLVPGPIVELPILAGLPMASPGDTSLAMIYTHLAKILALACYFVGYFLLPVLPARSVPLAAPKGLEWKVLATVLVGFGILTAFIVSRGGYAAHLTSLAFGRFRSLNVWAPVTVFVTIAPYAVALWAAYRPQAARNPLFWGVAFSAAAIGFLAAASRGSIVQFLAIIGLCLVARARKIPVVQVAVALPLVFLLIGALGMVRNSAWDGGVGHVAARHGEGLSGLIDYTNRTLAARDVIMGEVPVIARVPDDVPYLKGLSYGSLVTFFIPRAVWEDKPRGAGHYYATQFLNKRDDFGGVPIGPVAEAYWNFGVAGIVGVYMLFGAFHRHLARMVIANQQNSLTWVILAVTLVLCQPGSKAVEWVQGMSAVFALAFLFGLLRRERRRPAMARAGPPMRPGRAPLGARPIQPPGP